MPRKILVLPLLVLLAGCAYDGHSGYVGSGYTDNHRISHVTHRRYGHGYDGYRRDTYRRPPPVYRQNRYPDRHDNWRHGRHDVHRQSRDGYRPRHHSKQAWPNRHTAYERDGHWSSKHRSRDHVRHNGRTRYESHEQRRRDRRGHAGPRRSRRD